MKHVKDFDQERAERNADEREFTIGGETFSYQISIRPEALFLADEITAEMSGEEILARIDGLIEAFLTSDKERERWHELRARQDDPVSIRDLNELRGFLLQEQTGRPPTLPEPSLPGLESTGTNGTGNSSSVPEPVSKA